MKRYLYTILISSILLLPLVSHANDKGWGRRVLQEYRKQRRTAPAICQLYNDRDSQKRTQNFLDRHHNTMSKDTVFFIYSWCYPDPDGLEILVGDSLLQCEYASNGRHQAPSITTREDVAINHYSSEYLSILQSWDTTFLTGLNGENIDDGCIFMLTRIIYAGNTLLTCDSCTHYLYPGIENDTK